jgi:hypothetical protein
MIQPPLAGFQYQNIISKPGSLPVVGGSPAIFSGTSCAHDSELAQFASRLELRKAFTALD